ncbi:MAG: hypothetical protein ACTHNU_05665 [Gaiellales bacterium]
MTRAELERVLEQADLVAELRGRLDRARRLEAEAAQDEQIDRSVPEVVQAVRLRRDAITSITRELEREWVAQGPLVSAWQRAAELVAVAESAGAEAGDIRDEAEQARGRLESARLATRDRRQQLIDERERLVDSLLELPLEVELPAPVRDDGRPEAVRRDALAYAELADPAPVAAEVARQAARDRLRQARAELAELGSPETLENAIQHESAGLPEICELPADAPPSAAMRLRRAGVSVAGGPEA